jgi:hypothetical protein
MEFILLLPCVFKVFSLFQDEKFMRKNPLIKAVLKENRVRICYGNGNSRNGK